MINEERLQKVIANSGYCSRRHAEKIILQGRVKVNGEIINTLGTKVNNNDAIYIDEKEIKRSPKMIYLMFHKPRGCLTTTKDPKNRRTIMRYLERIKSRIYPVGRLDYDTSGFLLMTNDGDLTNNLTHPSHKVYKTYEVWVEGIIETESIQKLRKGLVIEGGFKTAPAFADIKKIDPVQRSTLIELSIREGKKHQVKNMILAINSKTISLKRISIGDVLLDPSLKPGQYRALADSEIKKIMG